jgi:hypothetical protein
MLDTTLTLGSFQFAGTEIPEKINFGGKQALVTHELVGGIRVVDSMGPQDAPIAWSGLLRGPNALARAQQLDDMRRAGQPLTLNWMEFSYLVVIESIDLDFERFYQVPYRISCTVIANGSDNAPSFSLAGLQTLLYTDVAAITAITTAINDATLSSLMSTVTSSVSGIASTITIGGWTATYVPGVGYVTGTKILSGGIIVAQASS